MSGEGHQEQQEKQQQQRYNPIGGPPTQNSNRGNFYEPQLQENKQEHYTDDDLRDLVDCFGRNREGKTTPKELRLCHNLLGLNPKERELKEDLGILTHERHDGCVATEDFVIIMRSKLGPDELSREELKAAFDEFDEDGSGEISPDELKKILKGINMPEDAVERIIKDADTDGDGQISFEEFETFYKNTC